MARKRTMQKSQGKARGAAPPLSLKNLSPLAWIFSAKGRSCSRGRGLGAWGRHLMVPELALRRARKNVVFLRRAAPGKIRCFCGAQRREKNQVFLRRAAPGEKIRCFCGAQRRKMMCFCGAQHRIFIFFAICCRRGSLFLWIAHVQDATPRRGIFFSEACSGPPAHGGRSFQKRCFPGVRGVVVMCIAKKITRAVIVYNQRQHR